MSQLIHRTTTTLDGPWLLDADALTSLDDLITHELATLNVIRKQELSKEVRRSLNQLRSQPYFSGLSEERKKEVERENRTSVSKYSPHRHQSRQVTVRLKGGQQIKADTFREVLRLPAAQAATVEKCEVELKCGEFRASMAFPEYSGQSMSISVSPASREASAECFVRLEQWALSNAVPKWIRVWRDYHPLQIAMVPAMLLLISMVGTGVVDSRAILRERANELLKGDLSGEGQVEALRLILSAITELPAGREQVVFSPWVGQAIVLTLITVFFLSFPPKSAVGIGTGAASIKRTRAWIWVISVAVPSFLIMGVLASVVGSVAFESLRATLGM